MLHERKLMNIDTMLSASSDSSDPAPPRPYRRLMSELIFLAIGYFATVSVASMFIAACGPGCCFVFYSIIAGVSGLFMFRQSLFSRGICLVVLLLSLFGMWHEKEVRDTWVQQGLNRQIQNLHQELEIVQPK